MEVKETRIRLSEDAYAKLEDLKSSFGDLRHIKKHRMTAVSVFSTAGLLFIYKTDIPNADGEFESGLVYSLVDYFKIKTYQNGDILIGFYPETHDLVLRANGIHLL